MTPVVPTVPVSASVPIAGNAPATASPVAGTGGRPVPFTRSAVRKAAAAPALAYLNGDKVPIGDFLALLVGRNEMLI